MDVLNVRGNRNGLNGEFFEFAPILPVAVPVLVSKARKARKKKYANIETQRLAEAFPQQDNSVDQNTILQQLLAESRATLEQRNKSKGKKRAELTGKLRAYDEYISDYQNALSELRASELKGAKIELENLYQGKPTEAQIKKQEELSTNISPTQTAPKDQVLGTASVDNQGTKKQMITPDVTDLKSMVEGGETLVDTTTGENKGNTMLYIGIGVVVVLFLIMRKK